MTDKIITTFETTLTWYDPCDVLPAGGGSWVLAVPKEEKVPFLCVFYNRNTIMNSSDIPIFNFWDSSGIKYNSSEIQWWANCPEFE